MKRTLSFNSRPPIRSYLHHAYATGILGNADELFNRYIDLEVRINDPYSGFTHFFDYYPWTNIEHFASQGLCTLREYPAGFFENQTPSQLISILHEFLKKDFFIEAYVDEHYLPTSAFFGKRHISHALLLTGFDDNRKEFLAATYRHDHKFGVFPISERNVAFAIMNQPKLNAYYTSKKAFRLIHVEDPCGSVSKAKVAEQIFNFLHPDPAGAFVAARFKDPAFVGSVKGLFVYEFIERHIRDAEDGAQEIDMRIMRTIWERTRIMRLRIQNIFGESSNLCERWSHLEATSYRFHLQAYQYNLSISGIQPRPTELVCDTFLRHAERERIELNTLLQRISDI